MVSDCLPTGLPRQFTQPASTADCGVTMRSAVSFFKPVPFITAITNFA
jgi:hypothetical protein